jgi:hypothetical protein
MKLLVLSFLIATAGAPADATPTDPVPGALERMKAWPGLGDAVTEVVMHSPEGRIHGHDARRIDIEVDEAGTSARVQFLMPTSFTLHGDRTVVCTRTDKAWACQDAP